MVLPGWEFSDDGDNALLHIFDSLFEEVPTQRLVSCTKSAICLNQSPNEIWFRADYLFFPAWMMPISFLLRESVPEHWLHWQQGAQAVNVACLVWLLATLVLSSGYSGTLLSSLMMNYYERPGCSSGEYDCISRFYMLQEISF